MPDPLAFYGLALEVLDCVAITLDATEMKAPTRRCVTSGHAVDEECCEREPGGGQLTVSLIRTFASTRFPIETVEVMQCGQGTTVLELEVKILRCASMVDANGIAPSCDQIAVDAQLTAADAFAVLKGVTCCFEPEMLAIGGQTWLDPDSCMGTTTRVLVDADQVCCSA